MDARRLAVLALIASTAGCASAPAPRAPEPAVATPAPAAAPEPAAAALPGTGLEFVVEPRDAQILLDGEPRGTVADLAPSGGVLALPPGIYQVSLRSAGFVTWRAEVAVRSQRERIEVTLVKKP
jgi:glucose/arabinose dehydrogenase